MKTKILIIFTLTVLLSSCFSELDDDQFGITFTIANNTDLEYTNASITIGGMKDGEFIGTESYEFPTLKIIGFQEWNTYGDNKQIIYNYINEWKPNLDLIRNIPSDSAYFKFKLEEGNETLLRNINYSTGTYSTLVSRAIPKGYVFKNDDGNFYIHIWKEGIIGRLFENE